MLTVRVLALNGGYQTAKFRLLKGVELSTSAKAHALALAANHLFPLRHDKRTGLLRQRLCNYGATYIQ